MWETDGFLDKDAFERNGNGNAAGGGSEGTTDAAAVREMGNGNVDQLGVGNAEVRPDSLSLPRHYPHVRPSFIELHEVA